MALTIRLALFAFLGILGTTGSSPRAAEPEAPVTTAPERFASGRAYAYYLRGRLAIARGDFRTAVDELRGALIFDDSSPQLHLALAQVWAWMAQLVPAEAEARRALERDPQGPAGAEALTLIGKIHASQRQTALAIEDLQSAIRLEIALAKGPGAEEGQRIDPEPWRVLAELYFESNNELAAARTYEDLAARVPDAGGGGWREMGSRYLEQRDFARAEKYLKKALEKDPKDIESWRRMAALEVARRRPAEARQAYQAILALDSEDLDTLLALGKLSLVVSDRSGASAHFSQLLRLAPEEGSARVNVAVAWLEAHRPAEALAVVQEGLKNEANSGTRSRLRFVQGLVFQDQRQWSEAARAYGAVGSEEDVDLWASARGNQAYCLTQAGQYRDAARVLEKPLTVRPRGTKLITTKAYVLERAGRVGEAVKLLEKALKERAGDPVEMEGISELYEALASSLEKSGRQTEAIALLERALGEHPRDGVLLYALGTAYEKAGNHDEALAQMKALLVVDPEHADALNFIGYSYAERGMKLDEAEKLISQALEIRPGSGFFLDSLGWVYFQKGEYTQALRVLEQANTLSGPEPTILEHLGDTYRLLRRFSDAAAAYRRALKGFEGGEEPERPGQPQGIERKLRELGVERRPAQR